MSHFEQWERVDFKSGPKKFSVKGGLFSKDANGQLFGLTVTDNNVPCTMTGTIKGIVKLPPHTGDQVEKYEFDGVIDQQDPSKVYVILPEECYYHTGQMTVAIRSINGDDRTVLATFTGWVDGVTDGTPGIPPGTLPDDIEDFLAQLSTMHEIVDGAQEAAEDAADAAENASTAATNATTAASQANTAATNANTAAAAISDFPNRMQAVEVINDFLLDQYKEEHPDQVLPFVKINSLALTGTGLSEGIEFDPDTTTYTVHQTFSTQGSLTISNIVLNNPSSHIRWSWSRRSGNANVSISGNSGDQQGVIMITHGTSSSGSIQFNAQVTDSITNVGQTYTFRTSISKS